MRLVSLFIFEPCSGWQLEDVNEYNKSYSCTDAFTEDLLLKEKMQLVHKTVDFKGNAMVIHLDMKSEYSVKHSEVNQAHYKAEAVMVY